MTRENAVSHSERAQPERNARVALRSGTATFIVNAADVEQLVSAGPYVRVHSAARSFLVRGSLDSLMDRLGRSRFVRVHRSTAVALDYIVEIRRGRNGRLRVVLAGGADVTAVRITREELESLVESR